MPIWLRSESCVTLLMVWPSIVIRPPSRSSNLNNSDTKKRPKQHLTAIEKIIEKFPDDLEAKAIRCYTLYKSRALLKRDYEDIDKQISQVLAVEPAHPVHHYRIHLWDHKDSARALASAAAGIGFGRLPKGRSI